MSGARDQREDLLAARERQRLAPPRLVGFHKVQFPEGVSIIEMTICSGRLFAVTSAGIFEIINGMAMPLPNYGYAL